VYFGHYYYGYDALELNPSQRRTILLGAALFITAAFLLGFLSVFAYAHGPSDGIAGWERMLPGVLRDFAETTHAMVAQFLATCLTIAAMTQDEYHGTAMAVTALTVFTSAMVWRSADHKGVW
jgi:hypothetical protein